MLYDTQYNIIQICNNTFRTDPHSLILVRFPTPKCKSHQFQNDFKTKSRNKFNSVNRRNGEI